MSEVTLKIDNEIAIVTINHTVRHGLLKTRDQIDTDE